MSIIISALLGFMLGGLATILLALNRIANLVEQRNDYRQRLINEKLKTEQRDILLRDIIKESVKTDKSTTNS